MCEWLHFVLAGQACVWNRGGTSAGPVDPPASGWGVGVGGGGKRGVSLFVVDGYSGKHE